ncbi:DUF418 domain-containing protein [Bacillus sp. B-jedd]|uniref:DUF418 domain-containing protein n=1 Tax=Bacillus sp. B-jedd TaxID=1476857 RepID=UPI00051570CE|nr:DUF418 domain-containing protein [Bacillus sp. B-jedd]CEG26044.1 putative integral inner membrane protein [Bacillus sp. B-jedd]
MGNGLAPTGGTARIISLDAMRGIAILGIYLVNMLSFHSPYMLINPLEYWNHGIDRYFYIFIDIFAQASFYPLFSMLFGYGLMLMKERSKAKGKNFYPVVIRRLFFLLCIGIVHAFLIWPGDILITYAVIGFLALFFLRLSGKALLATGLLMYIIPNLFLGLLLTAADFSGMNASSVIFSEDEAKNALQVYSSGTFAEITEMRIWEWKESNNKGTIPILVLSILPLFLIGAGLAKLKWLTEVKKHQKKLILFSIIAFGAGLLIKLLPYYGWEGYSAEFLQDFFGGPLLASVYGSLTALAVHNHAGRAGVFASVGRMAMTNYLLQSIVSTFIFYGYGAGLYGSISIVTGTGLAVAIYIAQAAISRFWLKRFHFGPVEWIWRSITYMKFQRMRKGEPA